ncbi:MAG: leucine-rich repeat domain-containing protein, partial [Clostridia bacterium]|nr:leucine-rich repeat domain-containing protein [Clostridia bacterium]
MKNIYRMIMATLLLLSVTAFCAVAAPSPVENADKAWEGEAQYGIELFADSAACGDSLTWSLDEDGVLSISGEGAMYNWDSVKDTPWYSDIDKISQIVVYEGVTSIGSNAFDIEYSGDIDADFGDLLYEVVSSGQIGSIKWELGDNGGLYLSGEGGLSDFASENEVAWKSYRDSITHVSVAESVTGIGAYAFYGMTGLEKVSLPDSVTSLGENAFSGCTALGEIYLGLVNSIPSNAFTDCTSLKTVKVGSYDGYLAIKEIFVSNPAIELRVGDYKKVIDIDLPRSVTSIGYGAFDRFFLVVAGYKNSYAEQFADSYGFEFIPHDVAINIGEKLSAGNIRYAEVDGFQYEIENDDNYYYVTPEKDMLVEIVEKESADSIYAVRTSYYYVDSSKSEYTELLGLGTYMGNEKEASIRTKDPVSVRYTSGISTSAKREEVDFVIEEYGFIVGMKSLIDRRNTQLNFDFERYAFGVAYNRESGLDLVFDSHDDEKCIFTGILVNVPVKNYSTVVTSKTYTKIRIQDKEFIVYGEP